MNRPGAYSVIAAEVPTAPSAAKLVAGLIALAAPEAAARATRTREIVAHVVRRTALADGWLYETAADLQPLVALELPAALALLAEIPRCEQVAAILRAEDAADEVVATGISLLACVDAVVVRLDGGMDGAAAVAELRGAPDAFEARFVDAIATLFEAETRESEPTADLPLVKLRVGMVCAEDLLAQSGSVIVPKNAVLQAVTLERLRRFAQGAGVREPVRVYASA